MCPAVWRYVAHVQILSPGSLVEDKGHQLAGPYVFCPLPRLATFLGFRYTLVYPFGGDGGLCLYPVPLCHCSLPPDLGVFCNCRGMCWGLDDLLTWVLLAQALLRALLLLCVPFLPPRSGTPFLSPITLVLAFLITVLCIAL